MTARMLTRYGLPVPGAMGPGGYKRWAEETKSEHLWMAVKFPAPEYAIEVMLHPEDKVDGVAIVAWVQKLLFEAKIVNGKQRLISAGFYRDDKGELQPGRLRINMFAPVEA